MNAIENLSIGKAEFKNILPLPEKYLKIIIKHK